MIKTISPHYAFATYFDQGKLFPFLYLLSQKMSDGNICLDLDQIDVLAHPEVGTAVLDYSILDQHELVGDATATTPFIKHLNKLYLHRYFHYEGLFLQNIQSLIANEYTENRFQELMVIKDFLYGDLFPKETNINWQLIACISAYVHQFSIITGGPGTGKTTTVSKLMVMLLQNNPNAIIKLAAPTGKAAARMKESQAKIHSNFEADNIKVAPTLLDKISQLEASTIHSLLGYIPNSIHFKHNENNLLNADIIIVDECSMIDIALFKKLLCAIDTSRTRLILLGDKNQLASVEAGSLFGDICTAMETVNVFGNSFAKHIQQITNWTLPTANEQEAAHVLSEHIVELQKSYRFQDDAGIGKLSKAILHSDTATIETYFKNEDAQIQIHSFDDSYLETFAALLLDEAEGYFYEKDIIAALRKINHSKILCATKHGRYGVAEANIKVEQYLKRYATTKDLDIFYENKMIMVTQNQADLGIYNGDIGIVRSIVDDNGNAQKYVCFWKNDKEYVKILPGNIAAWETAYAMTIHKSQGSEFHQLLVILPNNEHVKILTRELVYTAITRAKEKAILLSEPQILLQAAIQSVERVSGVKERLESVELTVEK